MDARTPVEILSHVSDVGTAKAQKKILSLSILSFFAGVFIAFAAEGSTMAAHNLLADPGAVGLARTLTGITFATGLMIVILAGAELFTGNTMIIIPVLERRVTVKKMLMNWLLVYIGNFIGCLFIAWMMSRSGLYAYSGGLLGGMTIKVAVNKIEMPFLMVFILGILCNWMVCLAIWASYSSRDPIGKIMIIFFVISLFVISGFEHSIANMYYIPAGIFAKQNPQCVLTAQVTAEQLSSLNWGTLWIKNLIPVTLGNIVGGVGFVWVLFWVALKDKSVKDAPHQ
jgi:formate/nitrite transporter